MYTREEFFEIPWEKTPKYMALTLKKAKFRLRIYKRNGKYENWAQKQKNQPWRLGTYSSLREAQFYGQHFLIYFVLKDLPESPITGGLYD